MPGSHPQPRLTLSRHQKVGKLDRMRQLWSWPEPGCQRWWSCWSGSGRPGSSLGEAKGVWRGYAACCWSSGKCFNHLTRTLEQHSAPWNDCVQTEEQRPGGVSVILHGGGWRSFSSELRLLHDPLQVPDGVRSGPTSTSLPLFIEWPVNPVSFSRLHVIPASPCERCVSFPVLWVGPPGFSLSTNRIRCYTMGNEPVSAINQALSRQSLSNGCGSEPKQSMLWKWRTWRIIEQEIRGMRGWRAIRGREMVEKH